MPKTLTPLELSLKLAEWRNKARHENPELCDEQHEDAKHYPEEE